MKKLIILGFLAFSVVSANCLTDIQTKLLDLVRVNERASKVIAIIKILNIDVNFSDEEGDTLLHLAARKGNLKLVQFLITRKANVNARNINNQTPLEEINEILSSPENSQRGHNHAKTQKALKVLGHIAEALVTEGAVLGLNLLLGALS